MNKLMTQSCSLELLEFQRILYVIPARRGETLQFLESLHTPDKLLFSLAQPRSIMLVSMAAFSHYGLEPVGKWPGLKMPGGLEKSLDWVPLSFSEGPRKG